MPHLVEMDKKYRKKGLTLIGAEVQGSNAKAVEAFAEKHDVEFPLTKGGTNPPGLKGIPYMVVFDAEGKCVFKGSPKGDDWEDAVKEALKTATPSPEEGDEDGEELMSRKELVAEREWVNADGNKLTAALVSLDGTTGTFRKPTGQTFTYDITKLSEADQEMIKAAAPEEEEAEEGA